MAQGDSALGFNGQDQYVTAGTAESLGLRGKDFTVEAWIKLESPRPNGPDHTILGTTTQAKHAGLHLVVRNGRLHLGFYGNDTPGSTPIAPAAWVHVAFRYTVASGEQALFVNGILAAAGVSHPPFAGTGPVHIGKWRSGTFFHGVIAEVRIWGVARAEIEIQSAMLTRLTGSEPGLSAYWPLDDGASAVARDARAPVDPVTKMPLPASAFTPIPGEIHGASWVPCDAPVRAAPAAGEAPPVIAARFDGTGSYITVADSPTLAIKDAISVEAWVNPTGSGKALFNYPVISKHGVSSGWELRAGAGQCGFMVTVNKVHHSAFAAGLDARFFYHVAGVYDGQVLRLYVNGVLRTSLTLSGPITPYPDVLSLGRNSYWPARLFAGQIAEARVFSRARTQAEIQQSMYTRLSGKEAGLVAQWRLEGDASDASPSGNGGLVRGGVRWIAAAVPLPATGAGEIVTEEDDPEKLRDALWQRYQDIHRLTEALDRSTAQIEQQQRALAALALAKDQLNDKVAALEGQLAEQERLSAQVGDKQAQIDALNSQVAELAKGGGAQTLLEDFVKNANDEIAKARAALKQKGSDYSLGRVTIDVKMLPGPGGVGMRFPQMDEMKELDAAHLSTLNVEFEAQETKAAAQAAQVVVPSVLDYTEVMARRKLSASNFLAGVSYQAVTVVPGEPIQVDRVVAQLPLPGAAAPSGSTVTIFIGRES